MIHFVDFIHFFKLFENSHNRFGECPHTREIRQPEELTVTSRYSSKRTHGPHTWPQDLIPIPHTNHRDSVKDVERCEAI